MDLSDRLIYEPGWLIFVGNLWIFDDFEMFGVRRFSCLSILPRELVLP